MKYNTIDDIQQLIGETLIEILVNKNKTEIEFLTDSGKHFKMFHVDDCCESVWFEDSDFPLNLILNDTILQAYESSTVEPYDIENHSSTTWTFYTIVTFNISVTLRWCGTSNGCYSESVSFYEIL